MIITKQLANSTGQKETPGSKQFRPGDRVVFVNTKLNEGFLDQIKNIPAEVEEVIRHKSYKSGVGLKIPLWHDPIDSKYFKKI